MTPRLYFEDPLRFEFESTVTAHSTWRDRPSALLAETAFYPEAGGQMADRGTLGGAPVLDVQVDDDGLVHHVLDVLPPVGATVRGEIDAHRRRLHMAQHTGQHLLSHFLLEVCAAETVSSRLGESGCTIDVDRDGLTAAQLAECEARVLSVIDRDVPVRAYFPTPEELRTLPLRRAPKQSENVRVVEVAGVDLSPCGGTHVTHASQIGLLRVVSSERYKGGTRVHFLAGSKARERLAADSIALGMLASELTCGPADVAAAVARLRRELDDVRAASGHLRARLASLRAAELERDGPRIMAVIDEGPEVLRAVAQKLTESGGRAVALAAPAGDGAQLVCARGPESTEDCGAWLRGICAACGGRGGGRPERAEGRITDLSAFRALAGC